MIGTTMPRRFITPFTNEGAFGIGVIGAKARISCTRRMSKAYSWSPTENVRYWAGAPSLALELSLCIRFSSDETGARVVRARQHLSRDALHVQDERYSPVAEDGGAGHALDAAVVGLEALDHDLRLPDELVDEEPEPPAARLHEDDERLPGFARERVDAEHRVQAHERDDLAADSNDLAVPGDRAALLPVRAKRLEDRGTRRSSASTRR
jgi:hypothetical protein